MMLRHVHIMKNLERLKEIAKTLREPGGCEWDMAQDFLSMRPHLIEEAYEAAEAVSSQNPENAKEELGDLLFIVFFYARLYEEKGLFDIDGVADEVCDKLIRRHPHVFGNVTVNGVADILSNWEKIKKEEKQSKNIPSAKNALDRVDRSLPALHHAEKIQSKAADAGFDWTELDGVFAKIHEELDEIKEVLKGNPADESYRKKLEEETGDFLFAAVNLSRHLSVHPEISLMNASEKFKKRYREMEKLAHSSGRKFESLSPSEKEELWNHVKHSG